MSNAITERRFITVQELAKQTGFCTRTLQEMYLRDGMPHIRAGRAVRFDLDRVAAWLEERFGQNCK